jgi:hypothetical protein
MPTDRTDCRQLKRWRALFDCPWDRKAPKRPILIDDDDDEEEEEE